MTRWRPPARRRPIRPGALADRLRQVDLLAPVRRARAAPATYGLGLLLQLASLLGPVWAFVQAVQIRWTPEGDDAMIALRAMDVVSTSPPVMGQRSTSGVSDPSLASHHLGPMEYYLMAPLGELFAWAPWSIALTMTLLAAVSSLVTVRGALRLGGPVAACGALGAVLLTQWAIGAEGMFRPFNPYPALLALLATMTLAWALLAGRWWAAPPFLVGVSFVAQANLAYAPVAAALAVGTGLLLILERWQGRRRSSDGDLRRSSRRRGRRPRRGGRRSTAARRALRRPTTWSVVLLVLCWLPTVAELVSYEPNNATQLYRYATAEDDPRGGLNVEGMLRLPEVFAPWRGGFGHLEQNLSLESDLAMSVVGGVVILLTVLGGSRRGLRTGRASAVLPCRVATLGLLGGTVTAALLPNGLVAVYWIAIYLPLAAFTWFALLWRVYAAVPISPNRPSVLASLPLMAAAAAAAVLAAVTALPTNVGKLQDAQQVVTGADEVVAETGDPEALVIRGEGGGEVTLSYVSAVAFDQHRQGRSVHDQPGWPYPEDFEERRVDNAPEGTYQLYLSDDRWPRPPELRQWSVPVRHPIPGQVYLSVDP